MSFSALLIGNETLTTECGKLLLARGHGIAAVVTHSPEVRAWALSQGLMVEPYGPDLAARLPQADWLLSIANLTVLPAPVLARARKGAVNFHDGPLPDHAGLNAPVWAILAGEVEHGVTWHLIEGGVDAGPILEERRFPIAHDETALTLNTHCFEAGLDSFPALLAQLETSLQPKPQASRPGTLHRRADRPEAFGRIDFSQSAESIARLVRALDHGRYWNPLTSAKIATGTGVLIIGSAEVTAGQSAPGTVLSATPEGLIVACGSGAIRLNRLTCQEKGGSVCPSTLNAKTLPLLTPEEAAELTAAHRAQAPHDGAQRFALKNLQPIPLPANVEGTPDWQSLPLQASLPHLALAALRASGAESADIAREAPGLPGYLVHWVPLRLTAGPIGQALAQLSQILAQPPQPWPLDLLTRDPSLKGLQIPPLGLSRAGPIAGTAVTLSPEALHYDAARLPKDQAQALAARLSQIAAQIASAAPETELSSLSALTEAERHDAIHRWNQTARDYDRSLMVHTAFEAQVAKTPNAPALAFESQTLTYAELNARANRAAHRLIAMGVTPGTLIGLSARRSLDLVVGALAIMKAGAAYVPMDPAYPTDRLALFVEDSACPVIVTHSDLTSRLPGNVQLLALDSDPALASCPETNPITAIQSQDLAYMIYTSGSTGRPKGVQVEHRNVVNFFAGMDARLGTDPGTWLAVTSLSFDISVLELFWTLARGYKVVISSDENRALVSSRPITSAQKMEFSLYYWGNDDGQGPRKYELLLEGARFADQNGFTAIWTPERHFHAFGGPYPNPSVTGAAVAAVTKNLAVRAGSCVVPLHHPARIAEEWAVIDNLTNGRSGIAIASGWHPDDFVLRPENAPPHNKAAMYQAAEQVRKLWRGEGVEFPKADGSSFTVKTQPRPVSAELDLWVTTAGNPETWKEAGAMGANVLTHLLGQSIEEVGEKIKLYHQALRDAGHDPARHKVTLMLHSCIGSSRDEVRALTEKPLKDYLASAAALVKQYAWAFPAFKKPQGAASPMDIDLSSLSAEENAAILDFAFQRYFEDSGLFGTVEDALARVEQLKRTGVSEIACLIDFGIAPDQVMASLPALAEVVSRANQGGIAQDDYSIAAQILRHGVTHLQCTPSMARMIALNEDSRRALGTVSTMLVGGEALPGTLVEDLRRAGVKRLFNMYGPTETTIWSSVEEVGEVEAITNIGLPLANQQLYVLDPQLQPVPVGAEGELWIGGMGVSRGYWQRPDLTADRFRPNPFGDGRIYGTGDLVRRRPDGKLDFLGRADHQVKLRGYRIELGEIEAVLERQPGVTQAVVIAREDSPGDLRLVAYLVGAAAESDLRQALAAALPEHMVPQHFVTLPAMPLTPNRKVDRKSLPAPSPHVAAEPASYEAPASTVAGELAAVWQRILGVAKVGARDNFFALGGHSLLAVQAHREIRERLGAAKISITDIFRFPVLEQLAAHIEGQSERRSEGQNAARKSAAPPAQNLAPEAPPPSTSLAEAMERRRAMRLRRRGVDA